MYGYKTLFGVESLEMDEIQKRFMMLFIQSEKSGCPMRLVSIFGWVTS